MCEVFRWATCIISHLDLQQVSLVQSVFLSQKLGQTILKSWQLVVFLGVVLYWGRVSLQVIVTGCAALEGVAHGQLVFANHVVHIPFVTPCPRYRVSF